MSALVLITLIGPLAVHMYIPIMPTIQAAFAVSTELATLSFSMVLFVMAFGTLLYGGASDRFGRRPVLLAGLSLFVGGSFVCAVSWSFEILLLGRFLQALAAGCGVVLARAIARDVYGPDKLAQVIAYLTAAYVLGPTLAPPAGGFVSDLFGWHGVFVGASAMSLLVVLIAALVIRETHHTRRAARRPLAQLGDYRLLVRNPVFVGYAFAPAMTSGSFFALAAYASYLMSDHYQGSAGEYGLYFMLLTLGFMAGNFICGRLGSRVRSGNTVLFGTASGIAASLLLAIFVTLFPAEPLALFVPGFFIGVGQGLAMPHAQAIAINSEPKLTGTASGAVMCLHFLLAAIASLGISAFYDGTFLPLLVVLLGLTVLSLFSALFGYVHARRRSAA